MQDEACKSPLGATTEKVLSLICSLLSGFKKKTEIL